MLFTFSRRRRKSISSETVFYLPYQSVRANNRKQKRATLGRSLIFLILNSAVISRRFSLWIDWRKGSPRVALAFYMTLERIQETPALKGAPLSPLLRSLSGTLCMISQQRSVSHRTSKYSSNRHRKLQPFRETWRSCRSRDTLLAEHRVSRQNPNQQLK